MPAFCCRCSLRAGSSTRRSNSRVQALWLTGIFWWRGSKDMWRIECRRMERHYSTVANSIQATPACPSLQALGTQLHEFNHARPLSQFGGCCVITRGCTNGFRGAGGEPAYTTCPHKSRPPPHSKARADDASQKTTIFKKESTTRLLEVLLITLLDVHCVGQDFAQHMGTLASMRCEGWEEQRRMANFTTYNYYLLCNDAPN